MPSSCERCHNHTCSSLVSFSSCLWCCLICRTSLSSESLLTFSWWTVLVFGMVTGLLDCWVLMWTDQSPLLLHLVWSWSREPSWLNSPHWSISFHRPQTRWSLKVSSRLGKLQCWVLWHNDKDSHCLSWSQFTLVKRELWWKLVLQTLLDHIKCGVFELRVGH